MTHAKKANTASTPPSLSVIDGGVNTGFFALLAAACGATVYGFERTCLSRVREHLANNPRLPRSVYLFNLGLGQEVGAPFTARPVLGKRGLRKRAPPPRRSGRALRAPPTGPRSWPPTSPLGAFGSQKTQGRRLSQLRKQAARPSRPGGATSRQRTMGRCSRPSSRAEGSGAPRMQGLRGSSSAVASPLLPTGTTSPCLPEGASWRPSPTEARSGSRTTLAPAGRRARVRHGHQG